MLLARLAPTWQSATFLVQPETILRWHRRNHAHETWACDFLQTYDLLFRPIFAFFVIEHASRRVVHLAFG